MTYYGKSNEEFRKDQELKDAIFRKLTHDYEAYKTSAEFLQKIMDQRILNPEQVYSLLQKSIWNRDFLKGVLAAYPEKDTYMGNQAAFMTAEQAQQVKEKYPESPTN